MEGISKDAVAQEAVTVEQSTEREMQQLAVQEGEEVIDSDGEEAKPANVITLDDILGDKDTPTADDQDVGDQDDYHQEFIRQMRMKDQLQQISKDKNFVNFDEDDEKFFFGLDGGEPETLEERERRRAEKKNLKMLESQPEKIEYEAIRKNLYIESREISLLTDKEVAEFRKKNGDIKVRGI